MSSGPSHDSTISLSWNPACRLETLDSQGGHQEPRTPTLGSRTGMGRPGGHRLGRPEARVGLARRGLLPARARRAHPHSRSHRRVGPSTARAFRRSPHRRVPGTIPRRVTVHADPVRPAGLVSDPPGQGGVLPASPVPVRNPGRSTGTGNWIGGCLPAGDCDGGRRIPNRPARCSCWWRIAATGWIRRRRLSTASPRA